MYEALVILHSWLRWLVLVAALVAVARGISGRMSRGPWQRADDAAGRWFTIALDVQMLIGLVLYLFLSPYTMPAWSDMGAAMGNPTLRYWGVEHLVGMIAAVALAHIGRVRIRKASDPVQRHMRAVIFFGLALLLIIGSTPWPFMTTARPLFRGF